ncbi:hypothetical protein ABZU32_36195 [Sphaerisporangium sp. NPDC005288]|uniref:hypothetical protein n=1 Tax=Sphaerisporangium sp. NPDC005288 TaxID=3155114 RepID=UPI0033BED476
MQTMVVVPGPGGRPLLATSGDDGTVRVLDPLTGIEIARVVMGAPVTSFSVVPYTNAAGLPRSLLAVGGAAGVAAFDVG